MKHAILTLLLLLLASVAGAQSLVEHYTKAMQARGESDFRTYHDEMQAAHELEPGHAVLQFHLARACAQLGELDAAQKWLDRAMTQGAWIDVENDKWLAPLQSVERSPEDFAVQTVERAMLAQKAAVGLELDEYDLVPEGLAFDPVDRMLYLSSVHKRKIIRVALDGTIAEFIPSRGDGYLAGLGIAIDAERRRLWSVSDYFEGSATFDEGEYGKTYAHCWSLEDGKLLGRWSAPDDSVRHGFNDLCVLDDGEVMITDSTGGGLYRARVGNEALEEVLAPGTLRGPNGICVNLDHDLLYLSEYVYGITTLDLRTKELRHLETPEPISTIGTDGLYFHAGDLIAVQNYAGLDRAARFSLDPAGQRVTKCEVLVARHERMDDPTTGAIVDGAFWFIANSHVSGFRIDQPVPSIENWGRVLLLECEL